MRRKRSDVNAETIVAVSHGVVLMEGGSLQVGPSTVDAEAGRYIFLGEQLVPDRYTPSGAGGGRSENLGDGTTRGRDGSRPAAPGALAPGPCTRRRSPRPSPHAGRACPTLALSPSHPLTYAGSSRCRIPPTGTTARSSTQICAARAAHHVPSGTCLPIASALPDAQERERPKTAQYYF